MSHIQKINRSQPNLVPRVSHLTAWGPGGKMRDPANEVDHNLGFNHQQFTPPLSVFYANFPFLSELGYSSLLGNCNVHD